MNVRFAAIALVSSALVLTACPGDDDSSTTQADGETDTAGDEVGDTTTDDTDTSDTTDEGTTDESTTDEGTTDEGTTTTEGGAACEGPEAPAGTVAIGQPFSRWSGGLTPDGEYWDYCNLDGTPFVLVISGAWCGPCQDLAAGMAGQPSGWGDQLNPIIAGLEAGSLGFVEVLLDNYNDFGPASIDDLHQWEMAYPNENIHLLGDETPGTDGQEPLWQYLSPVHMGGLPSAVLVDANFNVEATGTQDSIATAAANYGG